MQSKAKAKLWVQLDARKEDGVAKALKAGQEETGGSNVVGLIGICQCQG